MFLDPAAVWPGAGSVPPAAFSLSEPLAATALVLAALLLAAFAILGTSRLGAQRRPKMRLRLVRP